LAYIKEFQLEDEDYYAVDIARRTAYRILKCPNIKPEQVIGLGNTLYALERLPMITEGIRCEFAITYRWKAKETKGIVFRISEEVFEIVDSYSVESEGNYSYSNNLWLFNAFGFKDRGCLHLDDIELMIDEFMNNDIEINVVDESFAESETVDTSYKDDIIDYYAEKACKRISQKIIRKLQKMTEGMLTGDDSPLKNIWEEVCVQVQWEEFTVWDLYLYTIKDIIIRELEDVDVNEKEAIWLQTEEGRDWLYDEEKDFERNQIPFCTEEIVIHILNQYILASAVNWHNKRIEIYLESSYEFD